jgi:lysozyme
MSDISLNLINAIKGFEGFTPKAQWDYKQNSNGYGTKAAYPGERIDQETANQRLLTEAGKASNFVNSFAPNAPQGVRDALTSLTFNSGTKWANSGLGKLIQAGDYQGAQQRFVQYNRAGGQVNPGLDNRRQAEVKWFNGAPSSVPQQAMLGAPQAPPGHQAPQMAAGASVSPQANTGISANYSAPQTNSGTPINYAAAIQSAFGAPQNNDANLLSQMPTLNAPMPRLNRTAFQNIPLPQGFRGFTYG